MASNQRRDSRSLSNSTEDNDEAVEHRSKRQKTTKGNGSASLPSRRKTACQSCRVRKVKCDNQRPTCAICRSSETECVYLDNAGEKITLEAATELLVRRLDQLQKSIEQVGALVVKHGPEKESMPVETPLAQPAPSQYTPTADPIIVEPSRDYVHIPPHTTTADTVLTWPIFDGMYPPNSLISVLFTGDESTTNLLVPSDTFVVTGGMRPPDEERIPILIDQFLQNVHTKNPILDVEALVKHGRRCAEQGLGWDAWTCLVLIACALGSVSKPFNLADPIVPQTAHPESATLVMGPPPPSNIFFAKELQQGESCFVLACRRLGALKHTMLGAQCHFLAGVYLMYTLRPLLSWQYFYHASILCQLYLKTNGSFVGPELNHLDHPIDPLSSMNRKQRRLEQSLYWSCFKSECEFRVELPLPQSEIASYDYPNMFPSPPSPAVAEHLDGRTSASPNSMHKFVHHRYNSDLHSPPQLETSKSVEEDLEIRQHAKRLCNEEESWYYYLTEVALRRIGNRIINTFFRQTPTSWLNIKPWLTIALEFDAQVSSWSANLPPAMQQHEATSSIRAPRADLPLDGSNNSVSRELSWATENRLLEMRSWLYQPFLYYLIHSGTSGLSPAQSTISVPTRGSFQDLLNQPSPSLLPEESMQLQHMISAGIEVNLKILDTRSLRHRHHGLWYDLRATMTASLTLLAIVKSGHGDLIPGGVAPLLGGLIATNGSSVMGQDSMSHVRDHVANGKFDKVLKQFDFWAVESPDLVRHREVLERLVDDVRKGYFSSANQLNVET